MSSVVSSSSSSPPSSSSLLLPALLLPALLLLVLLLILLVLVLLVLVLLLFVLRLVFPVLPSDSPISAFTSSMVIPISLTLRARPLRARAMGAGSSCGASCACMLDHPRSGPAPWPFGAVAVGSGAFCGPMYASYVSSVIGSASASSGDADSWAFNFRRLQGRAGPATQGRPATFSPSSSISLVAYSPGAFTPRAPRRLPSTPPRRPTAACTAASWRPRTARALISALRASAASCALALRLRHRSSRVTAWSRYSLIPLSLSRFVSPLR